MIKLTDWDTGESVFVNESKIDLILRIQPSVNEHQNVPTELGGRTRIQLDKTCILVRETPDEVMAKFTPIIS